LTLLESILLGALQGITEFLPVSSSAHLILVPWFFQLNQESINKLTYDVMLHFGTLFAILAVYGGRFFDILRKGLAEASSMKFRDNLLFKMALATIPAAAAGVLFKHLIESQLRTPYVAVVALLVVSILMLVCERVYVPDHRISYGLALAIGVAQALALIPGASRSGITITVGILLGLRKPQAIDFSFLLAIPIILGAGLWELRHVQFDASGSGIYLSGMLSAFVFGAVSLKFLIGYLKKHSLDVFAYYRIGIALLILLFPKH
jgi:undecaprenyl-diphosphatase